MSDDLENSIAFKTACDLVFKGIEQPSGYTEHLKVVQQEEPEIQHSKKIDTMDNPKVRRSSSLA